MFSITIIQLFYLAAYALVHSLLASLPFKSLVWHVFGPGMDRWYTKFFSALAAVTLMPLILLLLISPGKKLYVIPSPWRWLAVAGQILAALATIRAFIDGAHRFMIGQQLHKSERSEPLQPRGIYCYVRDPFLLSGLVQIWLTPFMTANLLWIYLLTTVYLFLGSLHWEKRLRHQFGRNYENYSKKVPLVIPRRGGCRGDQ